MVTIGEKAPDFIAPAVTDGEAAMLELFDKVEAHKAVVLMFQPATFVPASTAELLAIQEAGWHEHDKLAFISLTGDSLFSHAAYADQCNFSFPLVSDFHGSIADSYGVLLEEWEGHTHIPGRAAVVIGEGWDVLAVQSSNKPLEHTPSPAASVTEAIRELDIDITKPEIRKESHSNSGS